MTNLLTILLMWNLVADYDVSSYKVYERVIADNAPISYRIPNGGYIDVGNTNVISVTSYPKYIQYFVVRAVNIWGEESDASNMIFVIEERN